jgi:signal transduction histidine kinase
MTTAVSEPARASTGSLRFHLALQKTRAAVFVISFVIAALGRLTGTLSFDWTYAALLLAVSLVFTAAVWFAYVRRLDERFGIPLEPVWVGFDIMSVTVAVQLTGGATSPWFIWYLAVAAAAAFVFSRRGIVLTAAAIACAYLVVVLPEAGTGLSTYEPALRMAFLLAASMFFLLGIANLKEKREIILRLQAAESQKVEELTRLTGELDRRTRELEAANRRIVSADQMKSRFLASMSHELRTPLNSIIGFGEILAERLGERGEAKHAEFARNIMVSGTHLLGIINDLLDLSRIEAGRIDLAPEEFAVSDAVASVCQTMQSQAAGRRIGIEVDVPSELPPLESDPVKFRQILYNLVSNAIKFSPEGSRVVISARSRSAGDDSLVEVSVADSGAGIPAEEQERIFDEFYRVESTAHDVPGSGLGLALVRRFVTLQNGLVEVRSTPGEGSTFTFALPVRWKPAPLFSTEEPDLVQ